MFYYFVWVRSNRYHGSEALTYASESTLQSGQIVLVELQTESVMGLVTGPSSKPRFKTKTIKQVLDLPTIPLHLIRLGRWLQQYYPASLGVVTQQLLPAHLSPKHLRIVDDTQYSNPQVTQLPQLTAQQSEAYAAMQMTDTYLVHGTTGSGKTRLYIEMALRSVAHGNSVIVLTPEISLTSQLARNFRAVFGRRVVILHSQQGLAARQQAWLQILRAKEPLIVIGPRSALFSPVRRIGLIVLDESHEAAYKQEQAPQYQTSRVASYLSKLSHASLILGSATPPISDYYVAIQKHKTIINLNELARKSAFPETTMTVIDMKERANFVRSAYLSQPMIEAISAALARGEQSLLYLNRRGTARLVLCERCGWQSQCPHCDIPLTYHSDSFELRCHSCSYHNAVPASCPSCQYPSILFKTAGTKAIVSEVERLFPEARIARFDTDNMSTS
jgi:primosomal protein N' (replication factor Y)